MLPLFRAVVKFCSTNRLFTTFKHELHVMWQIGLALMFFLLIELVIGCCVVVNEKNSALWISNQTQK